jgi:hypothetical protein
MASETVQHKGVTNAESGVTGHSRGGEPVAAELGTGAAGLVALDGRSVHRPSHQ